MEHQGEDYDKLVVSYLIKHYGNLLKISRERHCRHTLPNLRKYIAFYPAIVGEYSEKLQAEIDGMGLAEDAVLKSLKEAQLERLRKGESKDSTQFSAEIEKIIKEGKSDRISGQPVETDNEEQAHIGLIDSVLNDPLNIDPSTITKSVADAVREILTKDFRKFSLWSFEIQMGFKFQEQDFHAVVFEFCQKIVDGGIDRGIVTIPPRHSKTQIISIFLPLYSFCHNPSSQNIITSYADDVVQESSGYIRTIMMDPLFQKIFSNVRIDQNKRSLERWGTTKQGVLHAVPTGGKMTGKGAGSLTNIYSGIFCVDDVIKPKDAYSNTIRAEINDRYDNTFMSRLANDGYINDKDGKLVKCPRTPIVIIMQRVHDEDLVGFLLRGGSSDSYHYLNIPALVDKDTGNQEWYDKLISGQAYTNAIPYLYDLKREKESALWPARKSYETLKEMQAKTPYTFNSQYMGNPTAQGHGLVSEEWWIEYDKDSFDYSTITKTFLTADTASTVKTYSDYSVLIYWGVTRERNLVMLDAIVGKFETPELKKAVVSFWGKCNKLDIRFPRLLPRALYMEDKSSGQFLNQQFVRDGNIRCLPVPRDKSGGDKIARFLNTIPYFAQGRILFPTGHEHIGHMKREVLAMTSQGSGTGHDDVCDNISDAVAIEFSGLSANYLNWV
jgi:predicted phage terminase large subunit-like protein